MTQAWTAGPKAHEELKTAKYRLPELWQQTYQGRELLILLPDNFGTTQFLRQCPRLGGGL